MPEESLPLSLGSSRQLARQQYRVPVDGLIFQVLRRIVSAIVIDGDQRH